MSRENDPDVEWDASQTGTPGGSEELIDAGKQVVSVSTMRGRGRASGAEVTSRRYSGVWTIREGRVTRVVWFPTRAEALEAAGVRE